MFPEPGAFDRSMHTHRLANPLIACLLLAAAPALAADPASEQVAPLRAKALADSGKPEGLVALHRLYALKGQLEELAPLAEAFEAVAASRHSLPEVAALARFLDADVERSRGRTQLAAEHMNRLGMLSHFYVIGGFDNEGKNGFDRAFPPESEQDLEGRYPGKARDVRWRPFEVAAPDGYVDLSAALRPNREVTVYAYTQLDAAKDTRAVLHLGASGATRLYVDGQKVFEDRTYHGPAFDQRAVAVNLRKGSHKVLLKLSQDEGPLGFYMRVSGPRNEALPALAAHLPDKQVAAPPKGSLQAEVLPSLGDALEKRLKGPDAAQAQADLAQYLAYTRTSDKKDRRPAQLAAKAAAQAPRDAEIQLVAARLEDDNPNLRRGYLEAAAEAAPNLAEPQLELARDDLGRGHPDRALARLRSLATRADSVELQLLWARAEEDLGDFPASNRRVEAALRAHPRAVSAVREAARQDRRLDRNAEVVGHLRVAISLRYDDLESRRALVLALANQGDLDGSLAEQEKLLALDPTDLLAWARRGELLAYNGRAEPAKAAFAKVLELCPDDDNLRERQGRALLSLGDKPGAQQAFEAALALRPQNPRLKEALRALRGEERGFGEQFAVDARALIAAKAPNPAEDSEVLSEVTAIKVNPNGTSTRFVQVVARANTERGIDNLRTQTINYSPDRQEVSVLRTRTFRPDGSITETHSEGDQSISEPWAGIYYDARVRVVSLPNLQPGDAVEIAYRVDDAARDNLLSDYFGDLELLQGESPKDSYSYVLVAPQSRPIYANAAKLKPAEAREEKQADGTTLYKWTWKGVPKLSPEPHMPGWGEASASLHVSTYKDWESVGRFYWGLVRDQLTATDEIKKTAQEIGAGLPAGDDLAKVRAVYDFVVTKTRYVGLEFGIHGYKPYSVDRILSRRFGDCKDKASLMHALLEQLGVPSNLTLLRMRRLGDVDTTPASLAIFNHAILYVPKFDLYLDGTAEYYGSPELPNDDQGAMVLVIRPEGDSKIGHTPNGKSEQNITSSSYEVTLGRDGSAKLDAKSTVQGLSAPDYRRAYATEATRKATFEQAWSRTFPGLSVKKLELSDLTQLEQPVSLGFGLEVPHYADASPGGLIFSPFGKARSYVESFAALSQRKFDVVLGYPWQNRFSYTYHLPQGVAVRELPPEVSKESPFGSVKLRYTQKGDTLVCEGQIDLTQSRVKQADYPAFRSFLAEVDQALGRKIELGATIAAPPTSDRGAPATPQAHNP